MNRPTPKLNSIYKISIKPRNPLAFAQTSWISGLASRSVIWPKEEISGVSEKYNIYPKIGLMGGGGAQKPQQKNSYRVVPHFQVIDNIVRIAKTI